MGGGVFSPLWEGAVSLKGEFRCILGLIKSTFDWPGVSIFWPAAV